MSTKIKALAVYLPQYHPIAENDQWWGKGFTEWRNVVKGKKIIEGQYQPHIPADLGFYDLRLAETREQQAQLAQESGIYGFCYYHYWFNGHRLLETPLNEVLKSGTPDLPFCLCWANENWSRRWDGMDKEVLMKQDYSFEDDLEHIKYLCKEVFNDDRYIKVDGKPMMMIYRPMLFPDITRTAEIWRNEAKKHGFPDLYLGFYWSLEQMVNPKDIGFDFAAQFPVNDPTFKNRKISLIERVLSKLKIKLTVKQRFTVVDYIDYVKFFPKDKRVEGINLFPTIIPMWDNYVRRMKGGGRIVTNSTPDLYHQWLTDVCQNWDFKEDDKKFVFINAWNEWAEGNHLEPCEKWGTQYLDKTKEALDVANANKN